MKNTELLRSALQSLRANPKRSFLTTIGITIGIAAVITILALGNGVKKRISDEFNTTKNGEQSTYLYFTLSDAQSTTTGFNEADLNLIQERFGAKVKKVAISHETNNVSVSPIVGNQRLDSTKISLIKQPTKKITIMAGRNLTTSDLLNAEPVILMKESLAKKQYHTVQNAIGTSVTIGEINYRVVGVYQSQNNQYGDNKYGADLIGNARLFYSGTTATTGNGIKLTFYQGVNASQTTKKIKKYMAKKGTSAHDGTYMAYDAGAELAKVNNMITGLTAFISAIAGISLFIAGIGVMNMMYISVSERTQEIGIRLAVGASPKNVMAQFLLEAIVLTVGGGLLGFVIGWGLAGVISNFMPYNIHAVITLGSFLLAFGVSASVGIIFGILPAKQAANKNLIEILR